MKKAEPEGARTGRMTRLWNIGAPSGRPRARLSNMGAPSGPPKARLSNMGGPERAPHTPPNTRRLGATIAGRYSRIVSNWNLQPSGVSAFTALKPDIVS